eukprot:3076103-Pleurochrysis_carterae.AAC.1
MCEMYSARTAAKSYMIITARLLSEPNMKVNGMIQVSIGTLPILCSGWQLDHTSRSEAWPAQEATKVCLI